MTFSSTLMTINSNHVDFSYSVVASKIRELTQSAYDKAFSHYLKREYREAANLAMMGLVKPYYTAMSIIPYNMIKHIEKFTISNTSLHKPIYIHNTHELRELVLGNAKLHELCTKCYEKLYEMQSAEMNRNIVFNLRKIFVPPPLKDIVKYFIFNNSLHSDFQEMKTVNPEAYNTLEQLNVPMNNLPSHHKLPTKRKLSELFEEDISRETPDKVEPEDTTDSSFSQPSPIKKHRNKSY